MIRIIIAQDQAIVLGAIASLLGFEPDMTIVGRALDGDTALALVRDLAPQILLTDIEMPGRSGIDMAAPIAEQRLATCVVIVTTFAPQLPRPRPRGRRARLLAEGHTRRTTRHGHRTISGLNRRTKRECGAPQGASAEVERLRMTHEQGGFPDSLLAQFRAPWAAL